MDSEPNAGRRHPIRTCGDGLMIAEMFRHPWPNPTARPCFPFLPPGGRGRISEVVRSRCERRDKSGLRCWAFVALLLGFFPLHAAVPAVEHFFPVAAQRGTTNSVVAVGKIDPWPAQVWVDVPGLRFVASTNKGEFTVEVEASAPEGAHWVRVYNDEGASRPRCFIIESRVQTREAEPNDEFRSPQKIESLPAAINGRLEKSGDVDSYGIELSAGQTLIASVDAYVLESPLDAVLRVTDANGVQVAWNHDGRTLDPFLTYTAAAAGRYVVQVMGFPHPATSEIRFHGSDKCVYRLRLDAGPYVGYTLPLGARRGRDSRLRLAGWNLPAKLAAEQNFNGAPSAFDPRYGMFRLPSIDNVVRIPLGDGPEILEQEPNNLSSEANAFELPGAATGCVSRGDDVDRFQFTARKGERLQWNVQAVSLGFPVDAWLKIENSNGVQVARSEGGNGQDPELSWTPGHDGTFQAVVGSLVHRGGSNHWYRLSAFRPGPDYKVSAAGESFVFKAGSTNEVKVTVSRQDGFTNQLTVRVEGWPESVAAGAVEVPEKGGEVTLRAVVATNAVAFGGPFRIVAVAEAGTNANPGLKRAAQFAYVSTSENNGVPGGFRELLRPFTEQLWLTIRPAEPKKADEKKAK